MHDHISGAHAFILHVYSLVLVSHYQRDLHHKALYLLCTTGGLFSPCVGGRRRNSGSRRNARADATSRILYCIATNQSAKVEHFMEYAKSMELRPGVGVATQITRRWNEVCASSSYDVMRRGTITAIDNQQ